MSDATKPKQQQVAVRAGAPVAAMVPRSVEEAWRLAQAIAASDMAPKDMQRPEKIMVAIMGGAEIGLPPFQALQSFAIINGRPTLWGDGLLGVVRARGVKVKEWLEVEGDTMTARCEVTRPDTGEVIAGEFSVDDAKKAGLWGKGGPWTQYPKRMLKMRARAFAIRDGCADMLRGIQIREEVADYQTIRDVTPPAEMLALESHGDDGAEIEVIEVAPAPSGLAAQPEPETPPGASPAAKAPTSEPKQPAAAWAEQWRAKLADPEATAPQLDHAWQSPQNRARKDKAAREDAALVEAVSAEVAAAIASLETA